MTSFAGKATGAEALCFEDYDEDENREDDDSITVAGAFASGGSLFPDQDGGEQIAGDILMTPRQFQSSAVDGSRGRGEPSTHPCRKWA